MPRLLVVHHTPSPSTRAMLEAVLDGTRAEGIEGVEVVVRPALAATVPDALDADGYLLGTPANIGYISGALKHWLDQIYYPAMDATARRPCAAWVHGNNDTTGAVRALTAITGGMGWRAVRDTLEVVGEPSPADLEACWELGAAVAAALAQGLT